MPHRFNESWSGRFPGNDLSTRRSLTVALIAFLQTNLPKVKTQRLPNQQQFAVIWLFGNGNSFTTYIPADPSSDNNPQINSVNPFSPVTIAGQNYIVARVKDPYGERIHTEQVIREQVWHIKI